MMEAFNTVQFIVSVAVIERLVTAIGWLLVTRVRVLIVNKLERRLAEYIDSYLAKPCITTHSRFQFKAKPQEGLNMLGQSYITRMRQQSRRTGHWLLPE